MDNSSSSESSMDDASMDGSEQEHEYGYELEEPDPHEDYEGIPDEDFEDVPDDDDDEMDDDDEDHHFHNLPPHFTGAVRGLRMFPAHHLRHRLNIFHIARFENHGSPAENEGFSFRENDIFRDLFREAIDSIQRTNSRVQEQIRSMRPGEIQNVDRLVLSNRIRPSSREPVLLHPALQRPFLPSSELDRPSSLMSRPLRMSLERPHDDRPSSDPITALSNLQEAYSQLHGQSHEPQSNILRRLNSQTLATLEEVDLVRSIADDSRFDLISSLPRSRPFERLPQREREREREKVSSSLARRWCYEPQSTGGDSLPVMFDGDSAPRRPPRSLSRQPVVANETHDSVITLAHTITNRIDDLMIEFFKADDEVEAMLKKIERKKREIERKKAEEAKKADEARRSAKKDKEKATTETSELETTEPERVSGSGENMDISSEPDTTTRAAIARASGGQEEPEGEEDSTVPASLSDATGPSPVRLESPRTAPGLTNAQEEAPRPDLVMDSVEVAQRRSEEQQTATTEEPNQQDETAGPQGQEEPASTDFVDVAARRAAAAGISLDAPANNNPAVVAAATESTGIDPAFLAGLPENIRTEILTQHYERICTNADGQAGQSTSANTTTVNQDFLMALPPELRAEVLQLDAEFQSRQQNATACANGNEGSELNENNNGAMAATDMDNATFLATLAPELREEILLESGEAFIQSLPPNMAAEARLLRERNMSSRLPWNANRQEHNGVPFDRRGFPIRLRDAPLSGRRGNRSLPREPPAFKWKKIEDKFLREGPNTSHEPTVTLRKDGLSSLTQLVWLRHGQYDKSLLHQVLSHACKKTESRLLVLEKLIELVTSSPARADSSSLPNLTRSDVDRPRHHGVAVRRGLELLILLSKNDSVVAETLLGLPRSNEELEQYESITLSDAGESEKQRAPRVSLSTLVSLVGSPLFLKSNAHLEQLVSLINTVCQAIPPNKFNTSEKPRDRRSRRANRAMAAMATQMGEDPMNFFVVDNDNEEQSMYEVQDEEGDDEEDSDDDLFNSLRRAREAGLAALQNADSEADNASGGDDTKPKEKEAEKDVPIPDRYRIPKLRNPDLIGLSKVLLRTGCSERTYDKTSQTIGLLGELQSNRTVILYSLASIATVAGQEIQVEYRDCVNALRESENSKAKVKRAQVISTFSVASASNEITMLRVVKSLSTLLNHESKQIAEVKNEDETTETPMVSGNDRFRTSLLVGLRELWKVLDFLLELVSEEAKLKERKGKESLVGNGDPLVSAGHSASQVLNGDRKRSASRGLSPILARLSHMIEAFLVTHSIEGSNSSASRDKSADDIPSSPGMLTESLSARDNPSAPCSSRTLKMASAKAPEDAIKSVDRELALFVERHRGPINALLRANPSLLETSFKGALRHAHAIDFDNKKAYFRNVIRRRNSETHSGNIRIKVRRDRVFDDSYQQLRMRKADEMKGRLHVQFTGEEGVDAGGVTREWYTVLVRQIFDPNYALFTKSAAKAVTYQPDKRSYINREHLECFHFVGRIIGKAIYDGQLLDAYFTRSFYKHMLGLKPTYHDIEAQDPEYYKSLKWMLENDCTGIIDDNMSAEYEEFGKKTIIDLIPNGRNIPVTEENKADYVRLVTDIRMTKSIEKQIEAFKKGFYEIIPHDDCKIFNELELELLMSGLPDIDMGDLKANVEYTGYTASSPQINWFWRCVSKMDQEDLARLVMFVTGSSKMPLEGFSHLQGMNGIQKFQIHRVAGDTMRLPSAHTCFNQLDLPEYSSAEVLSERLLRAVRDCSVGFGFG